MIEPGDLVVLFYMLDLRDKLRIDARVGTPLAVTLARYGGDLLPVLAGVGKRLFPALADNLAMQAGAQVLFFRDVTEWMQGGLNKLGAQPPLPIDGFYGEATIAAVKAFQTANGLPPDGWAGDKTATALQAQLRARGLA